MITPKTNWMANDYFNVDDYNRIITNLNEAAVAVGVATKTYTNATVRSLCSNSMHQAITEHANQIAAALGWSVTIPIIESNWFAWDELNIIESICTRTAGGNEKAVYGQGNTHGDGLYYGGGIIE